MNFATFVQEWKKKYNIKHLGPATLQSYKHQIKNHILPMFQHLRLDQIKPMHIVNFISDGNRKDGGKGGLSSSTILHVYRVLRDIYELVS